MENYFIMLIDLFTKDMKEAKTLQELKELQVKYTGKKGLIKQKGIKNYQYN